ncbi:LUD domain-containing protein [Geobacter hydrogenophilus]|uniref:Lactate utilization protein C n=1 Tax=Geobacter hydrogenophilus TaxID=40983 RepID=A0A9W6LCI5_9BACT|nr:lactate utilization protein [Geobacter hydrogenophilus]MBT0893476.1 LUD domain-containing protein [Geobacter hydrogenophilus]GLI37829.1 lactate utilization protein C [Geobacter hydrogenophilus]
MSLTTELVDWTHEQKCRKAVASLEKNGFTAVYCGTGQEALDYIVAEAADAESVGFGGSMSVADLKVIERIREMGKELLIHGAPGLSLEERVAIMRRQLTCDLFLTGTNALTLSGWLVNIDATGNRVGSMFFGPRKVIVVAGRNKIVDGGVQEAIDRIKEWASPPNARRLNYKTPCGTTGFCSDCNSPDRICRITTVIDRKPRLTDLRVLVVNEEMGF